YDPITHEDYFQVFAILNQTQDSDKKNEQPLLSLFSKKQQQNKARLAAEIAALEKS
ncbi:MAG: hypothetical protein GTO03_01260, partial [Planctomycetales bacterium]|nr:hypothetical protein [Planctomycetales bacterium]